MSLLGFQRGERVFLFIDESEDDLHFVIAAIKSNDRLLDDIIWSARKKFVRKNKSLKRHQLADLNEFHEHILHDKYPEIKRFIFRNLVESTSSINHCNSLEIYAVFSKKPVGFKRDNEYRRLSLELLKVCNLDDCSNIMFDNYGNQKFQESIYSYLRLKLGLAENIHFSHQDSQKCKPIQAADCVAGCLRRSLRQDDFENFNLLQPLMVHWAKK